MRGRANDQGDRLISRWLATVIATAALFFTPAAGAGKFLPHKHGLSLEQKVAYFKRSVDRETRMVVWLESSRAPRTLERVTELGWFRAALAWHQRLLTRYQAKLPRLSTVDTICSVFGGYCSQAVAVARCESGLSTRAMNGQYLGLFQMGDFARSRYGHGPDALTQARAAYAYFVASGRDWSPWTCGWAAR